MTDAFVAQLATQARKRSASPLRVKGEVGVSSTKLKACVVFTPTIYKNVNHTLPGLTRAEGINRGG